MTERFTEKVNGRNAARNGIYGTIGNCGRYFIGEAIDKLAEYENAAEEGRLVVLPCKIGTPVYEVLYTLNYEEIGDKAKRQYFIVQQSFCYGNIHKLGKTIFLTRKEAQKALEEMEKNEDTYCSRYAE